jgi:hypothetical protein
LGIGGKCWPWVRCGEDEINLLKRGGEGGVELQSLGLCDCCGAEVVEALPEAKSVLDGGREVPSAARPEISEFCEQS